MRWLLLFALCSCSKEVEHRAVPVLKPVISISAPLIQAEKIELPHEHDPPLSAYESRVESQREAARKSCRREDGEVSFSLYAYYATCYKTRVYENGMVGEGACLWEVEVSCDDIPDEHQCSWTKHPCRF